MDTCSGTVSPRQTRERIMNETRMIGRTFQRLGGLLAMATLAACGGSGEDTQCSQVVAVLTAGLGCLGTVAVTSPPPPPPPVNPPPASPPPPPPAPGSNVVRIEYHVEYEPNNTLDNANPVSFRAAAAGEHIGMDITGAVTSVDDPADFFIFTPPRSGHFLVYLCADSCTESLQTDRVYLMVYDQSQSTLASTSVGSVETQHLGVELVAGLAYYVEVNGYSTASTAEDYKLVIID
jgi:hypothetical protein